MDQGYSWTEYIVWYADKHAYITKRKKFGLGSTYEQALKFAEQFKSYRIDTVVHTVTRIKTDATDI